jgi:hypothetical protein
MLRRKFFGPFLASTEEFPGFTEEGRAEPSRDPFEDSPASEDSEEDSHAGPGREDPASGDSGSDLDESTVEHRPDDVDYWKQRAHKYERLKEKVEDQLADVTGQLVSTVAQPAQAPVDDKPPYSDAQLEDILESGSAKEYHRAMQAVQDWKIAKVERAVPGMVQQTSDVERLENFLRDTDPAPGSQYEEDLKEEVGRVQSKFPSMNKRQAEVIAKGMLAKPVVATRGASPLVGRRPMQPPCRSPSESPRALCVSGCTRSTPRRARTRLTKRRELRA